MKHYFTILLPAIFFTPVKAPAQVAETPLLHTEKNFSSLAADSGTKKAFLAFCDPQGIVFNGSQPVNAFSFWTAQEENQAFLKWRADYSKMSSGADFGINSGPWWYYPNRNTDTVLASGRFVTVWHKTTAGNWKFLADLGVNNSGPLSDNDNSVHIPLSPMSFGTGSVKTMLDKEKKFIKETSKTGETNKINRYRRALSNDCLLLRNNEDPVTTPDRNDSLIKTMPGALTYTISGYGMAPSGDMGYVYGTVSAGDKKGNYLRVWQATRYSWKLLLEVVKY